MGRARRPCRHCRWRTRTHVLRRQAARLRHGLRRPSGDRGAIRVLDSVKQGGHSGQTGPRESCRGTCDRARPDIPAKRCARTGRETQQGLCRRGKQAERTGEEGAGCGGWHCCVRHVPGGAYRAVPGGARRVEQTYLVAHAVQSKQVTGPDGAVQSGSGYQDAWSVVVQPASEIARR